MTNFRVDVVDCVIKQGVISVNPKDYVTPCGMNSLLYLDKKAPRQREFAIRENKVAIYSQWRGQSLTGDYKPYRVQLSRKSNENQNETMAS
jgi:hypothetical protein